MLFTDFDASDKGRPVAVLDAQPAREPPPANSAGLTLDLDDIAASLGLDFEDDGEEAAAQQPQSPPPAPAPQPAREREQEPAATAAAEETPRGEDHELALGEADKLKKATGILAAPPPEAAPSWDELTSAFKQALPVEAAARFFAPAAAAGPATAFAPKSGGDGGAMLDDHYAAHGPDGEDGDVDVLSMLDEWLEHEGTPVADMAPFPSPRPVPYGGVERVSDWFAPPENQPEPAGRVENWYEPPEETEEDDPGETKVDISWLSDFRNELPEGEYWRKKTTRIAKRDGGPAAAATPPAGAAAEAETGAAGDSRKPSPSDTAELFSGMDIDGLWERKVASRERSQLSPGGNAGQMDLFDNLDVESLWEEKLREKPAARRAAGTPASAGPAETEGADETVIVDADQFDAAGTVILRDAPKTPNPLAPGSGKDTERLSLDESARRRTQAAADAQADPAGGPPSPGDDPGAAAPDDAIAHDNMEPIDFGAEDAAAGGDDGADGEPGPLDGDVDALIEEAAGMDFDGGVYGDGAPGGGTDPDGERGYVARKAPAQAPRRKGLTTDDLLSGIDLDSLAGGSGDVSAPVIDDSAIDDIAGQPRSDTGEMEAVAAGQEGEPGAESVPVNPMDVFANMDDMDFSDDMDDDMRAMMEEDGDAEENGEAGGGASAEGGAEALAAAAVPATRLGRALFRASALARRHLPMALVDKALAMVAWRENWWFYCDLFAAVVASASLAVIISYFFWYRGA